MFDIMSFIKSLKCSWVRRYNDNVHQDWMLSFDMVLRNFGGAFVFKCNLHPGDVTGITNGFIKQVCESWFSYSYKVPDDHFENQFILNNSLVRIDNRPFFYRQLLDANAFRISDLLNDNGTLMDYGSFVSHYNVKKFPFTMYFGILASLPSHWKSHLLKDIMVYSSPNPNVLCLSLYSINSYNKVVYSTLVKRIAQRPICITKWEKILSCNLDWGKIFLLPFKAVHNSKIRYFQFRFLHRILGINSFLYKIGYVTSPLCSFCNTTEETLSHLFYECPIVYNFWRDASQHVLCDAIDLDKTTIFFGLTDNLQSPLNFFILHTKHYIYSCRTMESLPNINHFIRKFSFHLKVNW